MTKYTHNRLINSILRKGQGKLLFPNDFSGIGTQEAIRQTLSRLVKEGMLVRLAQGIYLYPKRDPSLGILYPSMEDIAEAIAKRDKARIMPTDLYALHKIGLTTQVPMKVVYLTNGAPRKINIGKRTIKFKIATPKKMATKGKFSSLVIQALQALGKDKITEAIIRHITPFLLKEDPAMIEHDSKLAPAWVRKIFNSVKKKIDQ